MGGVVNIVTRQPDGQRHTSASVRGGSFGTWDGSLSHSARAGEVDYVGGVPPRDAESLRDAKGGPERSPVAILGLDVLSRFRFILDLNQRITRL